MSKQSPSSDEIDLLDLLVRFYDVIRRNLILAISLPLVGALLGFFMTGSASHGYFGRMMLETQVLSDIESSFIMEELKQSDTINFLLKQPYSSMTYEIEKGEGKGEGSSVYLTIQLHVNKVETFHQFQEAIIQVLNASESFIRKRKNLEFYYTELLKRTERELSTLDKAKSEIDYSSKTTLINPNDLFIGSVELVEKKMGYLLKLEDVKSVKLVKGFDPTPTVESPSRFKYSLAGFVAGGFIFMSILFLKFFAGYYKKYKLSRPS